MAEYGHGGAGAQLLGSAGRRHRRGAGADSERGCHGTAGQSEILEKGKMFHDVSVFLILANYSGL